VNARGSRKKVVNAGRLFACRLNIELTAPIVDEDIKERDRRQDARPEIRVRLVADVYVDVICSILVAYQEERGRAA
jgi:hypothetical protein